MRQRLLSGAALAALCASMPPAAQPANEQPLVDGFDGAVARAPRLRKRS